MKRADEVAEFERWLDRELPPAVAADLGAFAPPPPLALPRRSLIRRGAMALRLRGAAAVVTVALAVAGGGAALTTGSPNPVSWGHRLVHVVTAGSLVPQRTPAAVPHPPPARPTAVPDTEAHPQQGASDTGAASADHPDDSQGRAKPTHGDASPPPGPVQNRPPKDHGSQQGQNKKQ